MLLICAPHLRHPYKSRSAIPSFPFHPFTHTIMSLADTLLADLDGLSDDGGPSRSPSPQPQAGSSSMGSMLPPALPGGVKRSASALLEDLEEDEEEGDVEMEGGAAAAGYVPEGGVRPADELDAEEVAKADLSDVTDVGKVAKLHTGRRLKDVLEVSWRQRKAMSKLTV